MLPILTETQLSILLPKEATSRSFNIYFQFTAQLKKIDKEKLPSTIAAMTP
jgi:hypothetical protein